MRALHLHLPVHPSTPGSARRQLRQWLQVLGWPGEEAEDLVLAVNEAVSNAVEHAYSSSVLTRDHRRPEVELHVTDTVELDDAQHDSRRVTMTVTDGGHWRPRSVSPGFRGRGLQMMRALTESVEVTATGTGTRVKMISRAARVGARRAGNMAQRWRTGATLLLLTRSLPGLS